MKTFVWVTYRDWSFRVLEGLLDLPGWRCTTIVTIPGCVFDDEAFMGIDTVRVLPRHFCEGGLLHDRIAGDRPDAVFFYGWSWRVPESLYSRVPCFTFHPGDLPRDRGGSPIQNLMRRGVPWTWGNIISLEKELDAGPIWERERIPLDGTADDVWARMTNAGVVATRRLLTALREGTARSTPQPEGEPSTFRRMQREDAELKPKEHTARQMYDIVRAHAEHDANGYVVPAFIRLGSRQLVIDRAMTEIAPKTYGWFAWPPEDPFTTCRDVSEHRPLMIPGADSAVFYATRCRVRC